ncbi:MAG: hypothetical protein AB1414_12320 [bacterium]
MTNFFSLKAGDFGIVLSFFDIISGKIESFGKIKEKIKDIFPKTEFYLGWGNYDLIAISKVIRNFTSISQLGFFNNVHGSKFCLGFGWNEISNNIGTNEPVNTYQKMPLMGVTFVKIQNYLIHRYGFSIESAVINWINTELRKFALEEQNTSINIIGSWGWSEIIIIFHSDSYEKIKKCILKLRELPKSELEILQKDNDNKGHVLSTTFTNVGFEFDLLSKEKELVTSKLDLIKGNIIPKIYICCKPGHMNSVKKTITTSFNNDLCVEALFGKDDLLIEFTSVYPTKDFIKNMMDFVKIDKNTSSIHSIATEILFDSSLCEGPNRAIKGEERSAPTEYAFSSIEIDNALKNLPDDIPENLKITTRNMFSLYNSCISNRFIYDSFVDMRSFMEGILRRTENAKNISSLKEIIDFLKGTFKVFELGFRNRYYASYPVSEINDPTLEYKGGIQRLLTAIGYLQRATHYKLKTNERNYEYKGFCVIGNTEKILSSYRIGGILQVNTDHLFYPEKLFQLWHEDGHAFFIDEKIENKPEIKREEKLILIKCKNEEEKKELKILIKDIFSDIFAYRYGFNKNLDLFINSFWADFKRSPGNMIKDKQKLILSLTFHFTRMVLIHFHNMDRNDLRVGNTVPQNSIEKATKQFINYYGKEFKETQNESFLEGITDYVSELWNITGKFTIYFKEIENKISPSPIKPLNMEHFNDIFRDGCIPEEIDDPNHLIAKICNHSLGNKDKSKKTEDELFKPSTAIMLSLWHQAVKDKKIFKYD